MEKCVVTFPTTTAAMAMEFACHGANVPGRLLPVPRSISAGCGLCWVAPPECRQAVETLLLKEKISIDGLYAVML